MSELSFTIDDKALLEALKVAPEKVARGVKEWVGRSTQLTSREAKQEVSVDTGAMQSDLYPRYSKGGMEGEVKTVKKYAPYVVGGTGLYGPYHRLITPVKKKALAFNGIVRRSVKGQKANPFMEKAYKKIKPQIDQDSIKTLDNIVRSI